MRELGRIWDQHPAEARRLTRECGFVLAAELRAHGVDMSFTPVLDLDYGASGVIGDRAFHSEGDAVADLAHQLMLGLKDAGMGSVGKHFPGHGFVRADSHLDIPIDDRSYADIEQADLVPFRRMAGYGMSGVMPAHVIYPAVDSQPAGFSSVWLKQILRGELGFDGAVFSDDLSMKGASVVGDMVARVAAALNAGCDMALVCNDCVAADDVLARLDYSMPAISITRIARMHGKQHPSGMIELREQARYATAVHALAGIGHGSTDLWATDRSNTCGQA
jgi:beta-N-acetylhexosaminidase